MEEDYLLNAFAFDILNCLLPQATVVFAESSATHPTGNDAETHHNGM
jgi:hypothetical protein